MRITAATDGRIKRLFITVGLAGDKGIYLQGISRIACSEFFCHALSGI